VCKWLEGGRKEEKERERERAGRESERENSLIKDSWYISIYSTHMYMYMYQR
jgi:hypothetical protein